MSIHRSALCSTVQINLQLVMQMDTQWPTALTYSINRVLHKPSATMYPVLSMQIYNLWPVLSMGEWVKRLIICFRRSVPECERDKYNARWIKRDTLAFLFRDVHLLRQQSNNRGMAYRQRADMHDWLFYILMKDGHPSAYRSHKHRSVYQLPIQINGTICRQQQRKTVACL